MKLNLRKLFNNIFGAANDGINATSDVGREGRQIVRNGAESIRELKLAIGKVKATHNTLKMNIEVEDGEIKKWTDAAKKALEKGDENLARQCLAEKKNNVIKRDGLQKAFDELTPRIEALEKKRDDLQSDLETNKIQVSILTARSQGAQASEQAATVFEGIDGLESLDGLREQVIQQEARADALKDDVKDRATDLRRQVDALSTESDVDDELAALKAEIKPAEVK